MFYGRHHNFNGKHDVSILNLQVVGIAEQKVLASSGNRAHFPGDI